MFPPKDGTWWHSVLPRVQPVTQKRQQVTEIRKSSCDPPSGGPHAPPPGPHFSRHSLFKDISMGRWAGLRSPHPVPRHPLERLSFPELSCRINWPSPLESSRFCWVPSQVGAWGHNEKKKKKVEKNSRKNKSDWYTDIVVTPGRHKMDVNIMLNQVFVNFYVGVKWQ